MSSETVKDGGAAFPMEFHGGEGSWREEGMSLRDWLAGKAMAGHLASLNPTAEHDPDSAAAFARSSYQIADAMLAERAKVTGESHDKE